MAAVDEERAQKQREREDVRLGRAIQKAKQAFLEGPVGQARAAKAAGQRWFQIEMPLVDTSRTLGSMLFGDVSTKSRKGTGQGALLTEIEREGWELSHAGFVFHETGQVSRDKFFSSGQSILTTGTTYGVYLFRVTEDAPRDDEPWIEAVMGARSSNSEELPPDGWYDDPENPGQLRRWDGTGWTAEIKPK